MTTCETLINCGEGRRIESLDFSGEPFLGSNPSNPHLLSHFFRSMSYVYHTEDVLTATDKYGQVVTDSFGVTECYAINPNNGGVTHVPCPAATSSSSSHSNQNNNNGKPTLVLPVALGSVLGFFVLLTIVLLALFFRRRRRRNEEALEAEKLDHPAYSLTPFAPRQSILTESDGTRAVEGGGGREAATTATTTAGRRRSFRREDEQGDRTEEERMDRMMTRELGGGEDDDVLTRKLEGWKAVAVAREDDIAGESQWGTRGAAKQNPFGDSNAVYNSTSSSSTSHSHYPTPINTNTFSSSSSRNQHQHQSSSSPQNNSHLYSYNSPTNPFDSSSNSPRHHTPTTSSPQTGLEGSTSHLPLLGGGPGPSRQQEEDAGISLMRSEGGGGARRTSSEAPSIAPPAYEWRD